MSIAGEAFQESGSLPDQLGDDPWCTRSSRCWTRDSRSNEIGVGTAGRERVEVIVEDVVDCCRSVGEAEGMKRVAPVS